MIGRDERCPICGELLWLEWGFWSYEECLIWDFWYYKVIDFPVSHYRDVPSSQERLTEDDIEEIDEIIEVIE